MNEMHIEVIQTPGAISCNFDDIETALQTQMQAYEDLEVTEANIAERKADVATLRKISKAVDDERKRVKREFSAPLTEFEARVKRLTGILDEQIQRINAGLDTFERARIEEKRAHVKELYEQEIGDLKEFLPYEIIKSSRWDNKTVGDNEIISDLQEMKMRVKQDLQVIKALGSDIEDQLIATYKASGNNLATAIQKHTDYTAGKAAAQVEKKTWTAMNEPEMVIRIRGLENIEAVTTFLKMSEIEWEEV